MLNSTFDVNCFYKNTLFLIGKMKEGIFFLLQILENWVGRSKDRFLKETKESNLSN